MIGSDPKSINKVMVIVLSESINTIRCEKCGTLFSVYLITQAYNQNQAFPQQMADSNFCFYCGVKGGKKILNSEEGVQDQRTIEMKSLSIYKVRGSDDLDGREISKIVGDSDWFVYFYQRGDYNGDGFAVWKKNGKYLYSELGHCSCNGPLDDLDSIEYDSISEIFTIAANYEDGKKVVETIIKERL